MSKKMLINALLPEESRVAIVQDGLLSELDIEIAGKEQTKGNIYKAVVVRVEPGLQAAFVDYGAERMGFLQMGEIHPGLFPKKSEDSESRDRSRINDILRRGQELLVQIVKEERGGKGAALTTYLSLPGRYMVLMTGNDTKGISRKITEESERKELKKALAQFDIPKDMGVIVRTAAIGKEPEELKRDFEYLKRVYSTILERSRSHRAPSLVYKESNLVIRSIRDYFSSDMDEVLVDDPDTYADAKEFFQQVMPEYASLVKLHQEKRAIFSRYQIEEQIALIGKNQIPLPSGGSIVIDSTEALVAIDVNSGKSKGEGGLESTAYKTNLEAAEQAARQLRLRDLGGLIVIDFIDMRNRKHCRDVEKALKDALKQDKARVTVGHISQFGLLEMSRQRIKATLGEGAFLPCPHCTGAGKIRSPESQAVAFMRRIHAAASKGQIGTLIGEVPSSVADYLNNYKREELLSLEKRLDLRILIHGQPHFTPNQAELSSLRREKKEDEATFEVGFSDPQSYQRPSFEMDEEFAGEPAPAPAPFEAQDAAEAQESTGEAPGPEGAEAAAPGTGKKRRRRRKRGRAAAGEETADSPESEEAEEARPRSAAAQASPPEHTEAEEALQTEELPQEGAEASAPAKSSRRRRRGRRRGKGREEAGEAEAAEDMAAEAAHAVPGPEAEVPAPSPRIPKAAEAPAAPAGEEKRELPPAEAPAATPPESAAEQGGAPEEEKPAGRPRRKKAQEAAAPEQAEAAEKPAAQKAPRRKAAQKPEGDQPLAIPDPAAPTEEKPAPRPRRTSRARKAAEEQTQGVEAAPEKDASAKPAARKRAAPRKKAAQSPAEPTEAEE